MSDFLSFKSPASGRSSGASLYHGDVAVLPPIEPISTASESSAVESSLKYMEKMKENGVKIPIVEESLMHMIYTGFFISISDH